MKVRVNRLGERFDNITEVVNGVVVANSVNNLATAVDSDKYMETDPVRLAAAEEGRAADAHAAEVMKDLLDKAEVAKVDDDPLATQDYRDRANTDIQNMYTMPVELEEGLDSAHGLILDEKWDTPEEVAAWIAQEEERRKNTTGSKGKSVVYRGHEFSEKEVLSETDPNTVLCTIINRLDADEVLTNAAKDVFYNGEKDCVEAVVYKVIENKYVKDENGDYQFVKTKAIPLSDEFGFVIYEAHMADPERTLEKIDDDNTKKVYTVETQTSPRYPTFLMSYYPSDKNYRIKVKLPTDDDTLVVKIAQLFDVEYKVEEGSRGTKCKKIVTLYIPNEILNVNYEAYLKAIGRKPADWQTW